MARVLDLKFSRIQFTPDLMPSDITGTDIIQEDAATGRRQMVFAPGPIFANIVLADEINRATPKTQAALLECMEEVQVTSDGVTHILPRPFFVIATQNSLEHAGTYQLPDAQLDRFLIRLSLGYPASVDEVKMLDAQKHGHPIESVEPAISADELRELQDMVRAVHVDPKVQRYIVELVGETRKHPQIAVGSSPRGSLGLLHAAQAHAAVQGRGFVLPDDIKLLATSVLAHRIVLSPEARARGIEDTEVVADLLNRVPVPVGIGG